MIYPPQVSMIPVAVALARFTQTHGFSGNYPYWYLGTTPVRFLTGPVVPILLIGLHKIVFFLSYFDLVYVLLVVSFFASSVGWGILSGWLSKNKKVGIIVGVLIFFLPWRWVSALAMAEPSVVIAKNLLPWAILAMNYSFTQKGRVRIMIAILSVSFLLLIHTAVLFPLVVGVVALLASREEGDPPAGGGKERDAKKALLVFLAAIGVVTLWYTPAFWWTILRNPSIGGAPGILAIGNAVNFLKMLLPVAGAILAVSLFKKGMSSVARFSLVWLGTFGALTVFRFLANPAFWQDWTSWLYELEIGIALLGFAIIKKPVWWASLLMPIILSVFIYRKLGTPAFISSQLPIGIESLVKLNELAGNKRVFLSGSTVFWANSLFDLQQVRGGRDEVAVNRLWRNAAYEIREGADPTRTLAHLKELSALNLSHAVTEDLPGKNNDTGEAIKWSLVVDKVYLYQIMDAPKRARVIGKATVAGADDKTLDYLFSDTFDAHKEVVVEGIEKDDFSGSVGEANIVSDSGGEVVILANASKNGWLYLADSYYPGWKATIDTVPTQIYRANYAFRAVRLPAGEHRIRFIYDPASRKIGASISLVTFILFILFLLLRMKLVKVNDQRSRFCYWF